MFWAIISLGLVLRILALTQHDFWFDEAFTYHISKLPFKQILTAVSADNNPPLYYILIHFVIAVNKNEVILRLPSLAAGMATILLTYFLVYKFIRKSAALTSTAFVSLSPLTIYLSTEARPHSLGILFATLEIIAFLTLIKKPTRANSLLFILITIMGLYTHYYVALLLIPFTFILVKKKGLLSLRKWFMLVFLSGLAVLPWLKLSLSTLHSDCWCPSLLSANLSSLVSPAISGVGVVNLRYFLSLDASKFLLLALASFLTITYFVRGLTKNFYLTALYIYPLLTLNIIGFFHPILSPRAFAVFSPIYLSILALGAKSSFLKKLLIPALLFLFGIISLMQSQYKFFRGDPVKSVYNLVKTENITVVHTSVLTYYSLQYYSLNKFNNFLIDENPLSPLTVQYIGGQKSQSLPETNELWLVDYSLVANQEQDYQKTIARFLPYYYIERLQKFDNISVSFLVRKKDFK